jgi:hypothetical protein
LRDALTRRPTHPRAADGCTNSRETFADLNGGDYRVTLTVVRALVIVFLGLGVIKARESAVER